MSGHHAHLQSWSLPLSLALAATASVYLRGWLRVRNAATDSLSAWRLAAFLGGLSLVWIAIASPIAAMDHQSLTAHMVKHLLLMTLAAPLVLAGLPLLPLPRGLRNGSLPSDGFHTSWLSRRPERSMSHPVFCWLVGTAAVIGWHLPVAFQLAMRSPWVHSAEELSFLVAGLLFWWPIVQPSPGQTKSTRWSMALYLFFATLPCDILSAFLVFCNRLVYPCYLSTTLRFGLSPLEDQQCAGALMWVVVTFAYLVPAVIITMQMLSPSNRQCSDPDSQPTPITDLGVSSGSQNGRPATIASLRI
jgi:putative membrane protein